MSVETFSPIRTVKQWNRMSEQVVPSAWRLFKMQWHTGLKLWSEFSVDLALRTWLDSRLQEVPSNLSDSVIVYYFQNYIQLYPTNIPAALLFFSLFFSSSQALSSV